jgi:hypothetical protein
VSGRRSIHEEEEGIFTTESFRNSNSNGRNGGGMGYCFIYGVIHTIVSLNVKSFSPLSRFPRQSCLTTDVIRDETGTELYSQNGRTIVAVLKGTQTQEVVDQTCKPGGTRTEQCINKFKCRALSRESGNRGPNETPRPNHEFVTPSLRWSEHPAHLAVM